MATSTYKGYELQVTGTNSGTWGATLNDNVIAYVDENLGGITSKSLTSSNVTLSAAESRSALLRLTGTISAHIQITTAAAGFFFVENLTSGSFSVTITNGVAGAVVAQGERIVLFADATNGVRAVANKGLLATNNLSDVTTPSTAFANIKQAATESATGVVELATTAEAVTGTDTARAVTPAGLEAHLDAKAASQAQMETATATDVYVAPGTQKNHPLSPKAWALVTFSGTTPSLAAGSGFSAVSRNSTGNYTLTFSTAMSSTSYGFFYTPHNGRLTPSSTTRATGSVTFVVQNTEGSAVDSIEFSAFVFGDQ